MVLFSETCLPTDRAELNQISEQTWRGETLRLKPSRGLVGILASSESERNFRSDKIKVVSSAGVKSWDKQWIGRVFGLGAGTEGCGLEFGDIVQLNRLVHSRWFFRPMGLEGWTGDYWLESEDGKRIHADGNDAWVFVLPELIPLVLQTAKAQIENKPHMHPVAPTQRVIAKLFNFDELTTSKIERVNIGGPSDKGIAEIESIGTGCDETLTVGMACGLDPLKGVRFIRPDDRDHYRISIHHEYIDFVFDKSAFAGSELLSYNGRRNTVHVYKQGPTKDEIFENIVDLAVFNMNGKKYI